MLQVGFSNLDEVYLNDLEGNDPLVVLKFIIGFEMKNFS